MYYSDYANNNVYVVGCMCSFDYYQNEVTDIEMFIFSRTTHEEYPEKKSLQTTFYGWMILVIYDVL